MRLDTKKLKYISKINGLNISSLLDLAQVSRTAYYSLSRRDNLLPESLQRIAETLGVSPEEFIESDPPEVFTVKRRAKHLENILSNAPEIFRDNAWHTLVLLEQEPIERLRGALRRSRGRRGEE